MKRIVFSVQADCDVDMLPLWYWWYTNIFKADQIIIMAAAVKGSTSINQVRAFWANKDVIYNEKIYDTWFAPQVWKDEKAIVAKLLPKTDYLVLAADADECFEPPGEKHTKGKKYVSFKQLRLWTLEAPTLENVKTLPIHGLRRQNLLNKATTWRGAFINNFEDPHIIIAGALTKDVIPSGLYFFHFHFRGLKWFKNKFGKMKYDRRGPGSAGHWKAYTRLLQEDDATIEAKYNSLLKSISADSEADAQFINKFRGYFDSE